MKCHSKKFVFPKVAFCSSRKVNQPEVEMELRYTEKGPELSITGEIWNSKHTDIVIGGQCLDDMMRINELANNSLFKQLHKLWSLWHLNGHKSGGPLQEAALKNCIASSYEERCSYLESKDLLYEDGIKYGAQWWYHKIPDNDLKEIIDLLS